MLILIWPFPLKVSEGESLGFQKDTECRYQMQGQRKALWPQRPRILCKGLPYQASGHLILPGLTRYISSMMICFYTERY